jgi:flagellar biosynthetic protein FliP
LTASSLVALASALALTLGVVAFLTWAAKRYAPKLHSVGRIGGIEVLSRTSLAPRQGVATIRVEGRLMVVSFGDGGVRHIADIQQGAQSSDASGEPALRAVVGGTPSFARTLSRIRSLALALVLAAAGLAPVAAPLAAQAQPSPVTAEQVGQVISSVTGSGSAPQVDLRLGDGEDGLQVSGTVGTVLFIGFMTMIPTLLLLTTSFTRILIVLHLLKQALGTQTAPPAHLLAAMALLLTGFVMAPTLGEVHARAITPWMDGEIDEVQMMEAAADPMRTFMLGQTREQDIAAFLNMREGPLPETIDDVPFVVVTSAFVTSELTHAFQMGFALFLPFVVIDIVVASVLMSMGMFMLPPVMVSLPFKLLLFVLVDGWALVMSSLVQSF